MKIPIFLFLLLISSGTLTSYCFAKSSSVEKKSIVIIDPFSDFPILNNLWVQNWIDLFQGDYSTHFRFWLERSYRYIPLMRSIFKHRGVPQDLAYMAMIESGFSSHAVSSAQAVGYWQFILPTARRFGLRHNDWLDERKDFEKSTYAAGRYLKFLYKKFGAWVLAVAAYNMGEKKLDQLIKKHQTNNFWVLAQKVDFPYETAHYIPKLMAAITIAKAPSLFGFNHLKVKTPYRYEIFYLPGGTNLRTLSRHIGYSYQTIKVLNPGLLTHYLPNYLEDWSVRIPKGSVLKVSRFIQNSQKPSRI